jgi:hypothetical protein
MEGCFQGNLKLPHPSPALNRTRADDGLLASPSHQGDCQIRAVENSEKVYIVNPLFLKEIL